MAPDRGRSTPSPDYQSISNRPSEDNDLAMRRRHSEQRRYIAAHADEGQNFTVRGILVGLGVGLIICFSNMLGIVDGHAGLADWLCVLQNTVETSRFAVYAGRECAGADGRRVDGDNAFGVRVRGSDAGAELYVEAGGAGPAFLEYLEAYTVVAGLVFLWAVPLRRQVIIREKLKFPSGTATALMIGVLHGKETTAEGPPIPIPSERNETEIGDSPAYANENVADVEEVSKAEGSSWKSKVKLLVLSFTISGIYTLATYFFPILRNLPIFGYSLAENWLWTLNPSFAYVGQGIIMGPATTTHMLIGAIVGWGILSPLAKNRGWAPGPVKDWETGSKGWIVWISLAIMLADSVISLGYIALNPVYQNGGQYISDARRKIKRRDWQGLLSLGTVKSTVGYTPIREDGDASTALEPAADNTTSLSPRSTPTTLQTDLKNMPEPDAPPEHLVHPRTVWIGLILSILFCILSIRIVFGQLVPLYATVLAVLMALILSIMGVRALGETDLNPVSGISKLAQLFFALIIPQSNKNSVLINLIAGAVSEAGALQAGDLMQDLKTGHLLGAAPNAQFWGQIIGSAVGAVVSALIYRLYTSVYTVPGELFQVPTGYVWIFTARLVTGKGLPAMATEWAVGAAVVFTGTTLLRIWATGKKWHAYIPGGIAVAVGMYNVPSFTLARAIGGFVNWYWRSYRRREETPIVVLASGLILGEGVVSILNLVLASAKVPHL
ncbi:OPT oligopeptide transporter protein [Rutstroemia sp. NJR-2017a BBW]|nr:OPT oligopeptide transporter protein [Rutstroemia sp. NJR-2017a BBW]